MHSFLGPSYPKFAHSIPRRPYFIMRRLNDRIALKPFLRKIRTASWPSMSGRPTSIRLKFRPAPYPGVTISLSSQNFFGVGLGSPACGQLDYFTDKTQRASIAVTDPTRFVEAQASVHHRTFGASPQPGATIFLLRIEGASARFFSWFSAIASLAPTNAHLNCGPGAMLDPVWVPLSSQ